MALQWPSSALHCMYPLLQKKVTLSQCSTLEHYTCPDPILNIDDNCPCHEKQTLPSQHCAQINGILLTFMSSNVSISITFALFFLPTHQLTQIINNGLLSLVAAYILCCCSIGPSSSTLYESFWSLRFHFTTFITLLIPLSLQNLKPSLKVALQSCLIAVGWAAGRKEAHQHKICMGIDCCYKNSCSIQKLQF